MTKAYSCCLLSAAAVLKRIGARGSNELRGGLRVSENLKIGKSDRAAHRSLNQAPREYCY